MRILSDEEAAANLAAAGVAAVTATLTPRRLALLAAVRAGEVRGEARQWWQDGWRVVTHNVRLLQAAGLVEPATPPGSGLVWARITAAGVAYLDGER